MNKHDDLVYLDSEGHYGSATGMWIFDKSKLSAEQLEQLEKAKDKPKGVRLFLWDIEFEAEPYVAPPLTLVMSESLTATAEKALGALHHE